MPIGLTLHAMFMGSGDRILFMSCPAPSVPDPVPAILFLTLAALLLLSGCSEPDHGNGPLTEDPSFPVTPPAYPDVPEPGSVPVPPSYPYLRESCASGYCPRV